MKIRVPLKKEQFATYSHLFGLILALIGCIVLIVLSRNNVENLIVVIIYSICMCYMFSASTLYHAFKEGENKKSFWRIFDHIAIYFMIAGSYTVISFLYADGVFRWVMIALQWTFVLLGAILKILALNIPNWIDVGIYLIMGWMIVVRMDYMILNFDLRIFILVLLGGISYTIGAVLHAINKPLPLPGRFEFHDIFHILIIVGAGLHYLAVLYGVV
ncbi:MAG: hemolysin III family protein [Candidatus Heimdallarchaeota archaeon]|nr:hemolysin III family protein [Candidatus Heimdallarchaeota archaeon]